MYRSSLATSPKWQRSSAKCGVSANLRSARYISSSFLPGYHPCSPAASYLEFSLCILKLSFDCFQPFEKAAAASRAEYEAKYGKEAQKKKSAVRLLIELKRGHVPNFKKKNVGTVTNILQTSLDSQHSFEGSC